MKVVVKCTVPTSYQINSLRAFGLDYYKSNMDGSHTGKSYFSTIKAARNYLKNKAEYLYETKKEIKNNLTKNALHYDAGCAFIEKLNCED